MGGFALIKACIQITVFLIKRAERLGYIQEGITKHALQQQDVFKQVIHNAQNAYDSTPLDTNSLRDSPNNRDKH